MNEPFRVLLCDPPWLFRDHLPGRGRGARKHYSCMGLDALKSFDLPPLAKDCALFMWRCAAMQEEALELAKAWGFTIKSEIVWQKMRGDKPAFGMGHYVRAAHDTCLIGVRGRPKKLDATSARNMRSIFAARMPLGADNRPVHSAKPDVIHNIIERLYQGPYVELFARKHWPGWMCFGNELSGAV
jgi:N6-adenosine-specific RNA methylase IME4